MNKTYKTTDNTKHIMQRLTTRLSAFLSQVCAVAIAWLGFGCSADEPCMYGTPTGSFEIKGQVTTEEGAPVKGARIRVTESDRPSGIFYLDEVQTGTDGRYMTAGSDYARKELKVVCLPDNPALEADSVIVDVRHIDNGKDDPWNLGHAKATVDFKLKKKQSAE